MLGSDLPDISVLEKLNPITEENVQPEWIRERYPDWWMFE